MQELYTDYTAAQCLDKAESYMMSKDGSVKILSRNFEQVTFSYRKPWTGFETLVVLAGILFSGGLLSIAYVLFRMHFTHEVQLTARQEASGRTRLLVGGSALGASFGNTFVRGDAERELIEWIERELAPSPLVAL